MFSPLTWLLILLLVALLTRRRLKKWAITLAIVVFVIFSSPALYNMYAKWYQPGPVKLMAKQHFDFGIVTGGFGSVDDNGDGYFNSSADRFLQTVRLYKKGVIKNILISGGNSKKNDEGFREAAWARQQMIDFGVPASVIFTEDRSDNTRDNADNSKRVLDSLRAEGPYVLITSAFHMPRAEKLYRHAGLDIVPFPCNYTEGRGPVSAGDFIPSPGLLSSWKKYIKETVAKLLGR